MRIRTIQSEDNPFIAEIIRDQLRKNNLALPGTVYYDEHLDRLSEFYTNHPKRKYFVAVDSDDTVLGGIGLSEFDGIDNCAELQKLYLSDRAHGHGYSYPLIETVIQEAKDMQYQRLYIETHTNFKAAMHVYEKMGFKEIEKPASCMHSTMNKFYLLQL